MKIKRLCVLSAFLSFWACEVPLDDDTRILIKGQLIDENGQPIPDAEISVFARRSSNFLVSSGPSGDSDNLLGRNYSADNGEFSVISLLGRDEDFVVEIYVNDNYSKYQYKTNTEDYTPEDYLIDLGTVELKRIAALNFNIERTSAAGTEFQYTLAYETSNCREVYFNGELIAEETFCFETNSIGASLNDENPDDSGIVASVVGSEVIFTYSINGGAQESQIFSINQPDYEFNFTY